MIALKAFNPKAFIDNTAIKHDLIDIWFSDTSILDGAYDLLDKLELADMNISLTTLELLK